MDDSTEPKQPKSLGARLEGIGTALWTIAAGLRTIALTVTFDSIC